MCMMPLTGQLVHTYTHSQTHCVLYSFVSDCSGCYAAVPATDGYSRISAGNTLVVNFMRNQAVGGAMNAASIRVPYVLNLASVSSLDLEPLDQQFQLISTTSFNQNKQHCKMCMAFLCNSHVAGTCTRHNLSNISSFNIDDAEVSELHTLPQQLSNVTNWFYSNDCISAVYEKLPRNPEEVAPYLQEIVSCMRSSPLPDPSQRVLHAGVDVQLHVVEGQQILPPLPVRTNISSAASSAAKRSCPVDVDPHRSPLANLSCKFVYVFVIHHFILFYSILFYFIIFFNFILFSFFCCKDIKC